MNTQEKIASLRKEKGYTQEELANRIGVTKQTIQKYESGDIKNIPYGKLEKLSTALGTSSAYLLGLTEIVHETSEPPLIVENADDEYVVFDESNYIDNSDEVLRLQSLNNSANELIDEISVDYKKYKSILARRVYNKAVYNIKNIYCRPTDKYIDVPVMIPDPRVVHNSNNPIRVKMVNVSINALRESIYREYVIVLLSSFSTRLIIEDMEDIRQLLHHYMEGSEKDVLLKEIIRKNKDED